MKKCIWGLMAVTIVMLLLAAGCDKVIKVKGMVTGQLLNEAGVAPPMVNVRIIEFDSDRAVASENVNDSGHFIVSDIEPGHYKLQVVDAGEREWRVENDKASDFQLRSGKTLDFGKITIYPPAKD